jgi:Gluconate 2-dehydrogenase subunit 3
MKLPRQRNGTTPQMVGRYPDYDVLAQTEHWDDVTRRVVLDRVENVPPIRFFTAEEAATLAAFCDVVTAQDEEPRIPVLAYVDEKLHEGKRDGWQYHDVPDDDEVWRRVARGLDDEARAASFASFAAAPLEAQGGIVHRFSKAELHGGVWNTLNVSRAFSVVMRYVAQAFYSHPWAWNEIGFGGPAYPRGYGSFGSPHLGERESWEGEESIHDDPVQLQRRERWD